MCLSRRHRIEVLLIAGLACSAYAQTGAGGRRPTPQGQDTAQIAESDPAAQKFIREYLPKAKAGDAQAQSVLGQFYWSLGDAANAHLWLSKAAAQGDASAAALLNQDMFKKMPSPRTSPAPVLNGVCSGLGQSPEKGGVSGRLSQAIKQIPANARDARLTMIQLDIAAEY